MNIKRSLILLSALMMTACLQEAKMEMASLAGVEMAPLKIDFSSGGSGGGGSSGGNDNPHVIAGECPTHLTGFQLSINNGNWVDVTLSNFGIVGATDAVAQRDSSLWDTNCSDGKFSFWAYESALMPLAGGSSLNSARLRGIAGVFSTDAVELAGDHGSNSGGGPITAPTGFDLYHEVDSSGNTYSGQCVHITAYLKDSNGNHGSYASSVQARVKLPSGVSGIYVPNGPNKWVDCTANSATNWDFYALSAGESATLNLVDQPRNGQTMSMLEFYFIAPNYTLYNVDIIRPSGVTDGLTLSDASITLNTVAATTPKIYINSRYPKVIKNVCYPINLKIAEYQNEFTSASYPWIFGIQNSAYVELYSDSACAGTKLEITEGGNTYPGVSFSSAGSSWAGYFKLKSDLPTTMNWMDVEFKNFTSGQALLGSRYHLDIDPSGDLSVSSLKIQLSYNSLAKNSCVPGALWLVNSKGAVVPVPSNYALPLNVSLNSSTAGSSNGNFSLTAACTAGSPSLSASLSMGSVINMFYYTPTVAGTVDFSGTASFATSPVVNVSVIATSATVSP